MDQVEYLTMTLSTCVQIKVELKWNFEQVQQRTEGRSSGLYQTAPSFHGYRMRLNHSPNKHYDLIGPEQVSESHRYPLFKCLSCPIDSN